MHTNNVTNVNWPQRRGRGKEARKKKERKSNRQEEKGDRIRIKIIFLPYVFSAWFTCFVHCYYYRSMKAMYDSERISGGKYWEENERGIKGNKKRVIWFRLKRRWMSSGNNYLLDIYKCEKNYESDTIPVFPPFPPISASSTVFPVSSFRIHFTFKFYYSTLWRMVLVLTSFLCWHDKNIIIRTRVYSMRSFSKQLWNINVKNRFEAWYGWS